MAKEISKKAFTLSIVKMTLSIFSLLVLFFMITPDGGGIYNQLFEFFRIVFDATTLTRTKIWLIFVGPLLLVWLAFAIVDVVKSILFFVAVNNQKNGKKEYTKAEFRKKTKLMTPTVWTIFFVLACFIIGLYAWIHPWLAIALAIADGVVLAVMQKEMGLKKGQGKAKSASKKDDKAEEPKIEAPATEEPAAEPQAEAPETEPKAEVEAAPETEATPEE